MPYGNKAYPALQGFMRKGQTWPCIKILGEQKENKGLEHGNKSCAPDTLWNRKHQVEKKKKKPYF